LVYSTIIPANQNGISSLSDGRIGGRSIETCSLRCSSQIARSDSLALADQAAREGFMLAPGSGASTSGTGLPAVVAVSTGIRPSALTVTEKGLQRSKRTTPIKQRCSTKWRGRTSARSSRGARRGIKTQRHTDTNSGPAGISGRARVTQTRPGLVTQR
jgi:hypothetical protein